MSSSAFVTRIQDSMTNLNSKISTVSITSLQETILSHLYSLSLAQKRNISSVSLLLLLSMITKQKKAAFLSLFLNLSMFHLHAWPNRSDKYYDTIGATTHLSLAIFSLLNRTKRASHSQVLNTIFSVMWSTRLGYFLFTRILTRKVDTRFDQIKNNYDSFLLAFLMQSLWCFLGQLPILISNSNEDELQDTIDLTKSTNQENIGRILFLFGFFFEIVSDAQKTAFHAATGHGNKFITEGLWSISRHPNHFGEICLQFGLALSASRLFRKNSYFDLLGWLGPIFTTFLLTKVSGIPMLEKAGLKRWGNDPDYQKYLKEVPLLIPRIF